MKRLLLVALMVLVTLVGMVGVRSAAGQNESDVITQLQNIQQTLSAVSYDVSALQSTTNPTTGALTELLETVNAGVPAKAKMYYLTRNSFDGGDAITACDSGFHMASLFELRGPTELQYATSLSSAYVPARDQGSGPPTPHDGWVRPGFSAALPADLLRGSDNCDFWTTRALEVFGTTVHRPTLNNYDPDTYYDDSITYTEMDRWWIASATTCAANVRVWCLEDPENEERDLHRNDRSARR